MCLTSLREKAPRTLWAQPVRRAGAGYDDGNRQMEGLTAGEACTKALCGKAGRDCAFSRVPFSCLLLYMARRRGKLRSASRRAAGPASEKGGRDRRRARRCGADGGTRRRWTLSRRSPFFARQAGGAHVGAPKMTQGILPRAAGAYADAGYLHGESRWAGSVILPCMHGSFANGVGRAAPVCFYICG